MPLTEAAETMVAELSDLSKWEGELRRDLSATRRKIDKLNQGLDAILDLLDREKRLSLQARIAAITMSLQQRKTPSTPSPRVEAVQSWLADRDGPFTVAEVQTMLQAQGLTNGRHNASIILSRKVGQGVVRRVSRGWYEVNPNHPEIAGRRAVEA
ncbi:MAG: hypothetical protein AAF557_23925 [Pseudomonadota bacterium]